MNLAVSLAILTFTDTVVPAVIAGAFGVGFTRVFRGDQGVIPAMTIVLAAAILAGLLVFLSWYRFFLYRDD